MTRLWAPSAPPHANPSRSARAVSRVGLQGEGAPVGGLALLTSSAVGTCKGLLYPLGHLGLELRSFEPPRNEHGQAPGGGALPL